MQRDVPGFTRAAVPVLVDSGVKAVTLGVNGGSAPPDVPHNTPFLWRDLQSGTELIAVWHPGKYIKNDGSLEISSCLHSCNACKWSQSRRQPGKPFFKNMYVEFVYKYEKPTTFWCAGGYSYAPVDKGYDPEVGCVVTKGFDHILCAAWNVGDNSGPQNSTKVTAGTVTCASMACIMW